MVRVICCLLTSNFLSHWGALSNIELKNVLLVFLSGVEAVECSENIIIFQHGEQKSEINHFTHLVIFYLVCPPVSSECRHCHLRRRDHHWSHHTLYSQFNADDVNSCYGIKYFSLKRTYYSIWDFTKRLFWLVVLARTAEKRRF